MSDRFYEQESYFDYFPNNLSLEKWQKTVDVIADVFDVPGAWIMQANRKGLEAVVASESIQDKVPAGSSFLKNDNIYCKTVIESSDSLYVRNALKEGTWEDNPEYKAGFISYFGVPIVLPNGDTFGTLCVLNTKETDYSDSFLKLMWQMKELIDSDLKNIILIEKLHKSSTYDALTDVLNRRGFLESSTPFMNLAKRNKISLLLMYFDLNNLKPVNDIHGHELGDLLIQLFAKSIKQSLREEDIVARLGGDEFCFLGTNTDENSSNLLVARIQENFEKLTQDISQIQNPSFSVGSQIFDSSSELDIDAMLSEVDKLMYENKKKMKGIE